jgi:pimeloyl-ACP methyl ester carboxylesterase
MNQLPFPLEQCGQPRSERRGGHFARLCRATAVVLLAVTAALAAAPLAGAHERPPVPQLDWRDCDDGFQCATAKVPLDYERPHGRKIELSLIRYQATDREHRIGSLFVHPGGSGGEGVNFVRTAPPQALALIARRFDFVGVDTRGVGESRPAFDCDADPEQLGMFAQPFPRPSTLNEGALVARTKAYVRRCAERNPELLAHMSSADMARDFDLLRQAVGDEKLTYVGNSYGSLVGATYASLFPGRARALALTAPIDADTFVNRPFEAIREQTAAIEKGLQRFFAACLAHRDACRFGGDDPQDAFDDLAAQLDATPIPAPHAQNPRPVDGDDLRFAASFQMLSPRDWPRLASALIDAQAGDGSALRDLADGRVAYQRTPEGDSPYNDVNWVTLANDQRYPHAFEPFFAAGRHSASLFDYTYWNSGYGEIALGQLPVRPQGAFSGPFRNAPWATPALVIGTTHDTFVPYAWAGRLVSDLGNARLLTFRGDGHDVLTSFNPCVTGALLSYLEDQTLPAPGTTCVRDAPFGA